MRPTTRARLRRPLDRFRRLPRVTVVVWVPEGAGFVEDCLASIRASRGVRAEVVPVQEGDALEQAVASASAEYLTFLGADHTLDPAGLADLVAAVADGSQLAMSVREVRRGGRLMPVPPAGSPVDLFLPGKMFRTSFVRATRPPLSSWEHQAETVQALVRASSSVVVLPGRACVEHERDTSAPIDRQRRFRVDLVHERLASLRRVLGSLPAVDLETWCAAAVAHLLPQLCRDAVGGGPPFAAALRAFALDVVTALPQGAVCPVEARLAAWVAARGAFAELALVEDHLAGNPHGLPVSGGLAAAPPGISLAIPQPWLEIGPADRTLSARVLDLAPSARGTVRLRGNAFIAYTGSDELPEVSVSGVPVRVRRRVDPTANEWAARAHEDHSGCGFEAEVQLDALPRLRRGWRVEITLGGRTEHREARTSAGSGSGGTIDEVSLGPDGVTLGGSGSPTRVRLAGPYGSTPWAEARPTGSRFQATVPLVTTSFGVWTLPPGGRYDLEARGQGGGTATLGWAVALLCEPPDLVDDRLGLRPDRSGLVVGAPLTAQDRSALAQQQRISAYAAAPRMRAPSSVLLESFHGRVVADNPAAIGRELAGRDPELDLVWVVDDPGATVPDGTRAAPRRTQRWFDALAESGAYVGNAAAPPWFHKSDGQIHLQTWHGTPLKRIGEDRGPGDLDTWRHRRHLAGQAARWDAMVSPSPYCSEIFRSAFRYDGPMLEVGYPRNDVLLSDRAPRVRAATRQRLGLTDADRVVLYAPTWREYLGVRDSKPLFLDPALLVAAMPDTVVLVRGHYNASRQPDVFTDRSRIVDVTRYPDIADLYLAADSLVTDYSSVMFDFALTDKPMVLLTPDLDRYRDVERGFYFDIEAGAPGPMVTTTDDVVQRLGEGDRYADARARFRDRFCPHDDGNASARVCDHLLSLLERS